MKSSVFFMVEIKHILENVQQLIYHVGTSYFIVHV